MTRPSRVQRYIAENVYCRCGQAVTLLTERGLLARPEMPDSETEVHEWWLVSPRAAQALRDAGEPVVQFKELYLWGRTQAPAPLEDDAALARAFRAYRESGGLPAESRDRGRARPSSGRT